jgi:membrane associated rhomboid family serine protease
MSEKSIALLFERGVVALVLALPFVLIAIPVIVAYRIARQDRFRIMAAGASAAGVITRIGPPSKHQRCKVFFEFHSGDGAKSIKASQWTTGGAIERLGLLAGSPVQVHYRPQWAPWGFLPALAHAERCLAASDHAPATADGNGTPAAIFYVSYGNTANGFRWTGGGDVTVTGRMIRFWAHRRRLFWFPKVTQPEFALTQIQDMEQHDRLVRCGIVDASGRRRSVRLEMVSVSDAETLAQLLPATKTEQFVPVLAEGAEFQKTLSRLTPQPCVTPALIGLNALMFVIVGLFGGGLIVANPTAMIRFGTNFTPLTISGQWWRLLTSVFLHFGSLHIAVNMYALYVNGQLAERIYGSVRYLFIYLVAGLTASLVSVLWHPLVNAAGASGAIFGVIGALLAFFVKREGGVPASVIKAQRRSAIVFIIFNLLFGASIRGIDNAAHLGGLMTGFALGYLLSRPLTPDRDQRPWTRQWVATLGVCASTTILIVMLLANGHLAPRQARRSDGQSIPLAAPSPVARSLDGIRLGMTPDEVQRLKGAPLSRKDDVWLYNAVDDKHDGVISVYFRPSSSGVPRKTVLIEFTGHDTDSAPGEVPYLNALTTADVIRKYGSPLSSDASNDGWSHAFFPNGIYISTQHDKVFSYGVFDLTLPPT